MIESVEVDAKAARIERAWRGRADYRDLGRIQCWRISDALLWVWLDHAWMTRRDTAYVALADDAVDLPVTNPAGPWATLTAGDLPVDALSPSAALLRACTLLAAPAAP